MTQHLPNILRTKTAKAIVLGTLAYSISKTLQYLLKSESRPAITESPLKTLLPILSEQEKGQLPYPIDALPGVRDVSSPYGNIRVYEWGPESGRKVLLIHGISTPCIALRAVAHGLVDKGCRVMLFDLFGRGFSDNSDDLPQDSRLFCSQILICVACSPLSWTGSSSGGFSLVCYSLGGGIAAAFTSHFPNLISSLILITPSGLLRRERVSLRTRILYSRGMLPEPVLKYLVRRRLQGSMASLRSPQASKFSVRSIKSVRAEVSGNESNVALPWSHGRPDPTPASIVAFQVEHHQAFVNAYMSSMRYGPIMTEHSTWNRIGHRLSVQNYGAKDDPFTGRLDRGKVLVICADEDTSIVSCELVPDATSVFEGNVEFRHLNAGHEVPITNSKEVVDAIWEFWLG